MANKKRARDEGAPKNAFAGNLCADAVIVLFARSVVRGHGVIIQQEISFRQARYGAVCTLKGKTQGPFTE